MPMRWTFDASHLPSYLRITSEGEVTPDLYKQMWNEILSSDSWRPGMSVIVDGRDFEPVAPEHIRGMTTELANFFADRADDIGTSHIARLVNPENFQSTRRFQYALMTRDLPMTFQIFVNESDAILWLEYFEKQASLSR